MIAAEDQNFCRHNGFDWAAIDKAMKEYERNPKKRLRGASTISQQAARTLFLVPMRSWIRKGLETYLTVLMEALWPKKRILDAYLNLVDWGDGIYWRPGRRRGLFRDGCRIINRGAGRPAGRHPAKPPQMAGGAARPLCRPAGRLAAGPQRHGGARRAELLREVEVPKMALY